MDNFILPSSPNWFLPNVSCGNEAGLYAFGSRYDIFVYDVSSISPATRGGHGSKPPKLVAFYTEHSSKVVGVQLSPDPTQWICCSCQEESIRLWDIRSLVTIQETSHTDQKIKMTALSWSSVNTDVVYAGTDKGVLFVWKLKSNTLQTFECSREHIICVAASPHVSNVAALGYRTGLVVTVRFDDDRAVTLQRLRANEPEMYSISWCPVPGEDLSSLGHSSDGDGALLATAGKRYLKVWSTTKGKELIQVKVVTGGPVNKDVPDQFAKKTWIDTTWPKINPQMLVVTGLQGDLMYIDLCKAGSGDVQLEAFTHSAINKHTRLIFNVVESAGKLCTFSLDRMIAVWDVASKAGCISWSSFAGHIFCARASPLDPGRIAIGAGDNNIRVWNQNNKTNPGDATHFFNGIRSKVTCLAWHPEKEGILAYGTEDGRVGVYNTLSAKHPVQSATFHSNTAYVVCWAPVLKAKSDESCELHVYSVGDGKIFQHYMDDSKREAVVVTDVLDELNEKPEKRYVLSEMSWRSDFSTFCVGRMDGSVAVYSFPSLKMVCHIEVQSKLINCIRWHPDITAQSPGCSPCRGLLAIAGNDGPISLVDLSKLCEETSVRDAERDTRELIHIVESQGQLPGDSLRTTDMCWSPHNDGLLVSVGYDGTAKVWNARLAEQLACYKHDRGRLLTVVWSQLHPDFVMSAGTDGTFQMWRISEQPRTLKVETSKRKKKKKFGMFKATTPAIEETASTDEIKELQELLRFKERQLMAQMTADDSPQNGTLNQPLDRTLSASARQSNNASASSSSSSLYITPPTTLNTQSNHSSGVAQRASGQLTDDAKSESSPPKPTPNSVNKRVLLQGKRSSSGSVAAQLVKTSTSNASGVQNGRAGASHRRELVRYESDDGDDNVANDDDIDDNDEELEESIDAVDIPTVEEIVPPVKLIKPCRPQSSVATTGAAIFDGRSKPGSKQKVKQRTLFSVSAAANNRARSCLHEDILDLTKIVTGGDPSDILDKKPHLGLYTDKLGAHRCLLQESAKQVGDGKMDYHLHLEMWRGNVAGAVQLALQRNELSDWIVAMAPMASKESYEKVCVAYAAQLEEDGQYYKAVSYLLAANRVLDAIDVFQRHNLHREAIALAKVRLSPIDPILETLYTEWGASLMKEGQFEQSAKCYLAMKQVQEAGKVIAKRLDLASLKTACQMSLVVQEQGQALNYAHKVFTQHILNAQWKDAYDFLNDNEKLKIFLPVVLTHESLVQQLSVLCPNLTLTHKPSSSDNCTPTKVTNFASLPEFMLDRNDIDPVVPWEPLLFSSVSGSTSILPPSASPTSPALPSPTSGETTQAAKYEGPQHTFPHHLLKCWHQHLNISTLTKELKATRANISRLNMIRPSLVDVPNLLVIVSIDITSCLLALLASDTESAINHLLQAMSTVQIIASATDGSSGQKLLLPALCQLMLSQGPKYLLKLQQEFKASRVLLTMESDGDLSNAGGEGSNSIKRFLTDVKVSDNAISTNSTWCRELDCVRAFYYLGVLDFIQEYQKSEKRHLDGSLHENDSLDGEPTSESLSSSPLQAPDPKNNPLVSSSNTVNDNPVETSTPREESVNLTTVCEKDEGVLVPETSESVHRSIQQPTSLALSDLKTDERKLSESDSRSPQSPRGAQKMSSRTRHPSTPGSSIQLSSPRTITPLSPKSPSSFGRVSHQPSPTSHLAKSPSRNITSIASSPQTPRSVPPSSPGFLANTRGILNHRNFHRLSCGLLWDTQAKSEALTETLGYIHRSISQHLLANRANKEPTIYVENLPEKVDASSIAAPPGTDVPTSQESPAEADPEKEKESSDKPALPSSVQQSPTVAVALLAQPEDLEEDGSLQQRRSPSGPASLSPSQSGILSTAAKSFATVSPRSSSTVKEETVKPTKSEAQQSAAVSPSKPDSTAGASTGNKTPEKCDKQDESVPESNASAPKSPSTGFDHRIGLDAERELLGDLAGEPESFFCSQAKKVMWMEDYKKSNWPESDLLMALAPEQRPKYLAEKRVSPRAPDGLPLPIEWDDLPVDVKYNQSYVSMPLLKHQKEAITRELKRGPDISKAPFPSKNESVKRLLECCIGSPYLPLEEKRSYIQQLYDWASLFSVTTYQKAETEELFKTIPSKLAVTK